MPIFSTRPATAIDEREAALNDEIARLEKEIAALKGKPARSASPRPEASVRTAQISGASMPGNSGNSTVVTTVVIGPPVEAVEPPLPLPPTPNLLANPLPSLKATATATALPVARRGLNDPRFNELGERKFDLGQWWAGMKLHFHRETVGPANPEMVKYLATGSVHGLRPLRFERRIARNRTIGLVAVLVVVLYGLAWVFFRR